MRRAPDRQGQITALSVVLGAAIMFEPVVWLIGRWREAVGRDPGSAWGARWLGEQLSAHPSLTIGLLLLGVALASGLVILILGSVAKRLADRLTDRARSARQSNRS
jgi:hypothetical protein